MKNTVRNRLVPFSFRVSSRARAKAMTLMRTMDTTAKATVNQKDFKNWASAKARW